MWVFFPLRHLIPVGWTQATRTVTQLKVRYVDIEAIYSFLFGFLNPWVNAYSIIISLLKTHIQWCTDLRTITVYVYTSQVDSVPQEMSLIDLNQVSIIIIGGGGNGLSVRIWSAALSCSWAVRIHIGACPKLTRVHSNRPWIKWSVYLCTFYSCLQSCCTAWNVVSKKHLHMLLSKIKLTHYTWGSAYIPT